jgi:hypothetical protein
MRWLRLDPGFGILQSSCVLPNPHLFPQLMAIHERIEPLRLVRWQRSSFTICAWTSESPDSLEVLLKLRVNDVECRTISLLLDAFRLPSLLFLDRRQFGTSS